MDLASAKPGTPEWWFNYLLGQFTALRRETWQDWRYPVTPYGRTRRDRLNLLWSYYVGRPPLPEVAQGYEEAFRDVMRKSRSNYAPMCVNAMLDRMELRGVDTAADSSANGDDVAADIADVSNLVAVLKDTFAYAFSMSEAYALVVPAAEGAPSRTPIVTALDPRYAIGAEDPNNPTQLRAFLMLGYDPILDRETAALYLPGLRYFAARDGGVWDWTAEPEPVQGIDSLGGIPAVKFPNLNGLGEYEPHLDLLDRINDTTLQRMVLTMYQSFRQRAVIGDLEGAGDDDYDGDGEADAEADADDIDWGDILRADPGALWRVPEGVTFWESNQADLTPIITAKRDDVKEFAAVTSTPLHLITPDAASGSAEGASLMRESLNQKVRDRRARFTPALKLMFRIAFAFAGAPERGAGITFRWGSIESNSLAEKGAATAQAQGVLSKERILSDVWDMDDAQIGKNMQELTADQLLFGGSVNANDGSGAAR